MKFRQKENFWNIVQCPLWGHGTSCWVKNAVFGMSLKWKHTLYTFYILTHSKCMIWFKSCFFFSYLFLFCFCLFCFVLFCSFFFFFFFFFCCIYEVNIEYKLKIAEWNQETKEMYFISSVFYRVVFTLLLF